MASISGTFNDLWDSGLSDNARTVGVSDADLSVIRAAVKSRFIDAGWSDRAGNLDFVSDADAANALQVAKKIVRDRSVSASVIRHKENTLSACTSPTKSSVLSASSNEMVGLQGASHASVGSFNPQLGGPDTKCPRCSSSMETVVLANNKGALYCTKDRVVVPT